MLTLEILSFSSQELPSFPRTSWPAPGAQSGQLPHAGPPGRQPQSQTLDLKDLKLH